MESLCRGDDLIKREMVLKIGIKVHVHRLPAVTLNETLEEFHISSRLCQKI